jgi:hypothetical protein
MKKLLFILISTALVSAGFIYAQLSASDKTYVKTTKSLYDGEQLILKKNDRICVIINPTSILPTTSSYLIIDYKIVDTSATVNIVVQGKLYP